MPGSTVSTMPGSSVARRAVRRDRGRRRARRVRASARRDAYRTACTLPDLEHRVERSLAELEIDDTLRQHALGDLVVVVKRPARLHRVDAGELRREHQLVDVLLRAAEFAADRKRARDVRRVALVLAAGVDQQQVAGLHLAVVVAVVQHAGVGAGGDDRRIRDRLRAGAQEFVRELGLDLVLVPARPRAAPSRGGARRSKSPRRGASARAPARP